MVWSCNAVVKRNIPEEVLAKYFRDILRYNSPMIIVTGKPGKGKSFLVGKLCELIDPRFVKEDVLSKKEDIKPRITVIVSDPTRLFGVINLDDFGSELDPYEAASEISRELKHLYQVGRTFNLATFITIPHLQFINKDFRDRLVNYRIEVDGHNKRTGKTVFRMYRINFNQDINKSYKHRIYFNPLTGKFTEDYNPLGELVSAYIIGKPSDQFIKWYLPQRTNIGLDKLKENNTLKTVPKEKLDIGVIIKSIRANPNLYLKSWRGGHILNKPLIRAHYPGVGLGTAQTLAALVDQDLKEGKIIIQ
jgi:hypothetical protein